MICPKCSMEMLPTYFPHESRCPKCGYHFDHVTGKEVDESKIIREDEFDDYGDDDWDDEYDFDSALSSCGIGADGFCSMAGSELCDWECPMLKFGFHGTEIDDEVNDES